MAAPARQNPGAAVASTNGTAAPQNQAPTLEQPSVLPTLFASLAGGLLLLGVGGLLTGLWPAIKHSRMAKSRRLKSGRYWLIYLLANALGVVVVGMLFVAFVFGGHSSAPAPAANRFHSAPAVGQPVQPVAADPVDMVKAIEAICTKPYFTGDASGLDQCYAAGPASDLLRQFALQYIGPDKQYSTKILNVELVSHNATEIVANVTSKTTVLKGESVGASSTDTNHNVYHLDDGRWYKVTSDPIS